MGDDATALITREYRAARRLARLFRIERAGRFGHRPHAVVLRLQERRNLLIDELMRLEDSRRALAPSVPPLPPPQAALDQAMVVLAQEVDRAEQWCIGRLAELGAELDRRRGFGTATGLRDMAGGQLLGHG